MSRVRKMAPHARRALKLLEKHPFREQLIRAILLLQDGLITRNDNHRLLRYWSALEQIYVESDIKSRSNEKALDRAVFAEIDPDISR